MSTCHLFNTLILRILQTRLLNAAALGDHTLILESFADAITKDNAFPSFPNSSPRLVLVGSVRDSDDATRVYNLRLLAHELKIKEKVEFVCDASWPQILDWLQRASVGVNGMWNEHFGIGVVEYQAAGLISVVNDSGGPKLDIVVEIDGKPTGKICPPDVPLNSLLTF